MGFGRPKVSVVQHFPADRPEVKIERMLRDGFIALVEQGFDVAVRIGNVCLVTPRVGTTQRALVVTRA